MVNYDYDSSILNNTEYIRKQLHCSRTIDRQLPLVADVAHSAPTFRFGQNSIYLRIKLDVTYRQCVRANQYTTGGIY